MITPNSEFWKIFKETNGALSCAEAVAIMNIAAQAPDGLAVELGVYKGKSAISAVMGFNDNPQFYLVEPEFKDKEWVKEVFYLINDVCHKCNRKIRLKYFHEYSTQALPYFNNTSYCFIDSGSHQDGLPMQEVKLLEDRMVQCGIIAFHDFRSQFVEVEEAYNYLLGTGKYEEIIIDWKEITAYVEKNNIEDGTNQSWHHTELKHPCFVGAVKRK